MFELEDFPIGTAVRIEQDNLTGQYLGNRCLTEVETSVDFGTVVAHRRKGGGSCYSSLKVELTSGQLVDNPLYVHKHVWHPLNHGQCRTFLKEKADV